jgi:hypothetical protein
MFAGLSSFAVNICIALRLYPMPSHPAHAALRCPQSVIRHATTDDIAIRRRRREDVYSPMIRHQLRSSSHLTFHQSICLERTDDNNVPEFLIMHSGTKEFEDHQGRQTQTITL